MTKTTIGKDRDGRGAYHDGSCANCGAQFMSDRDVLIIVGSVELNGVRVRFCGKCERAAELTEKTLPGTWVIVTARPSFRGRVIKAHNGGITVKWSDGLTDFIARNELAGLAVAL